MSKIGFLKEVKTYRFEFDELAHNNYEMLENIISELPPVEGEYYDEIKRKLKTREISVGDFFDYLDGGLPTGYELVLMDTYAEAYSLTLYRFDVPPKERGNFFAADGIDAGALRIVNASGLIDAVYEIGYSEIGVRIEDDLARFLKFASGVAGEEKVKNLVTKYSIDDDDETTLEIDEFLDEITPIIESVGSEKGTNYVLTYRAFDSVSAIIIASH